ncbi:hypothetical protein PsorP6_000592 [Peronosclerospora sorghi]|uniref:Uncharacterized protein n=1 Tax=Peronosclerospora sorghi TaxID=230839 RepID=A0ACC0WW82_9STRA|nr:hypothetical protein PsorP6_000592 [Peronosclerospora sorghi]
MLSSHARQRIQLQVNQRWRFDRILFNYTQGFLYLSRYYWSRGVLHNIGVQIHHRPEKKMTLKHAIEGKNTRSEDPPAPLSDVAAPGIAGALRFQCH